VDVRIIAATNKDLKDAIKQKTFREDFLHRLKVILITLPPLRERPEDIEPIANHFLKVFNDKHKTRFEGISAGAMKKLHQHNWPGNVRELQSTIESAVVLNAGVKSQIDEDDLKFEDTVDIDIGETSSNYEDKEFLDALQEHRFNFSNFVKEKGGNRDSVMLRFKGICFKLLVEHDVDVARVAEKIGCVEEKVQEHYNNLTEMILKLNQCEGSIIECRRRYKNMPKKYHPYLEALVKRHFDQ